MALDLSEAEPIAIDAPESRHPTTAARVAGALTASAGAAVLVGWVFGIASLTSVAPGLTRMSPLTAVTFMLTGVVLWVGVGLRHSRRAGDSGSAPRWFAVGGILIALIGLYRLCDYGFAWKLNIDQLGLTSPPLGADGSLSLMAPATAVGFSLLGPALLLVPAARRFGVFQTLCLLVAMVGWLGCSHYIYGGEPLLPYTKMAFHTSMLFMLLSAGILCARPDRGLVALLRGDSAGSLIARRLVPAAVFVPAILGWLRLEAQRAGWFDTEAGVSLFAISNITVFGALIWTSAQSLHQSDIQRRDAQRRVHSQLERLRLLEQITHAIGQRQDPLSIFQVVARALEDHLPVDFICVCRWDPQSRELTVTSIGLRSQRIATAAAMTERDPIDIEENGLSRALRGELVYESDLAQVTFPFSQRLARAGLHSLVIAPMLTESKLFGLLVAARRDPNSFSSADCEFLRQLSEHTALAANQALLYHDLQTAYEDLHETQQAVMHQERLRMLGQMASGVAHDINNSLSPVALYTDSLLEHETQLSPRAREYLQTIRQAIDDAAETIGRMRLLYRPREPETELARVQLNELVPQVVALTESRWSDMPREQGVEIRLETELRPDLPVVAAIESEVRDSLVNLIFNAVDAMPKGGRLTVRTRLTSATTAGQRSTAFQGITVEVCDTGTGMDEATREKCLEPFFTTKGERGSGLGLAMVFGMIQRHGGALDIESALGQGTTIRLTFPVPTAMSDRPATPTTPVLSQHLRILVVDDDPLILQSLRNTLESDGHTVVIANGGQDGIDLFDKEADAGRRFDIVITDLGMPDVDGRKVAGAIKARSSATPVIMLTGWGRRMATEAESPNVDCILAKPPKLAELRQALARYCTNAAS